MKKTLAFIAFILFLSCTKTISYNSPPIAVYTLGSGGNCTAAAVSGRYVADTGLTSANTVTITVNVTSPGPYWITTDSVNGIIFSDIGTFTQKGLQTAVLTGTGTPDSIDTANFTIRPMNGPGGTCTFSIGTVMGVPPHYYVTCLLNGIFRNFSDSASASNSDIPGSSGFTGLDIRGRDTILNSTEQVEFGVNLPGSVGAGTYADTSSTNAYFKYMNTAGQAWSIDTASGRSAFTLVVLSSNGSNVQGTFSGTIKNQQGPVTDSISVTNGVFSVPVQ